jgi:hypothetical protein
MPPVPHTQHHLHSDLLRRTNGRNLRAFQKWRSLGNWEGGGALVRKVLSLFGEGGEARELSYTKLKLFKYILIRVFPL